MKNANTVSEAATKAVSSTNSSSTKIVTTSQRKVRPKFVRQMSFDLDTDTETSLTIDGGTISVTTVSSRTRGGHIKKQPQSSKPQDKKKISSTSNLTEQSTITNNVIEDPPPHGLHPPTSNSSGTTGGASTSSKNIEIVEAATNTEANMTEDDDSKEASNDETNSNKKRSRPALTIKIQNSSFHDQENEEDLASELEKSPRLYISGK